MKEMEEDTNKWNVIPFSWIRRINTIKIKILSIHPKWSADSRQSLSKFHWHFSQKQKRQHYNKSHMELQAICSLACFLKPKQSWERTKFKASPILISNCTESYSQNSMVQVHGSEHIVQGKRTESLDIHPCITLTGPPRTHYGERQSLQ